MVLCFVVGIILLPWSVTGSSPRAEQHCVTVKPGEDVSLYELPSNRTFDYVRMKKDGLEKDIYCERDGHKVDPPDVDSVYSARVVKENNTFTLMNVSSQDNGKYTVSYKDEEGKHQVIIYLHVSSEEQHCVTVKPGDNVSLPLELPSNINDVWMKKVALDNDSSCQQDRHKVDPPDVEPAYWIWVKRVHNKFTLKNVSSRDSGKYVLCYLHVTSEVDWRTVVGGAVGGVLVLVLIIGVTVGVVIYYKCRGRLTNRESDRGEPEEAEQMMEDAADSNHQPRPQNMENLCNEVETAV